MTKAGFAMQVKGKGSQSTPGEGQHTPVWGEKTKLMVTFLVGGGYRGVNFG